MLFLFLLTIILASFFFLLYFPLGLMLRLSTFQAVSLVILWEVESVGSGVTILVYVKAARHLLGLCHLELYPLYQILSFQHEVCAFVEFVQSRQLFHVAECFMSDLTYQIRAILDFNHFIFQYLVSRELFDDSPEFFNLCLQSVVSDQNLYNLVSRYKQGFAT